MIIVCLLNHTELFGQDNKTQDSLFAIAYKQNTDTSSVNAFLLIQRNFFNRGLYDSTLKYSLEAITVAKKIDSLKPGEIKNSLGDEFSYGEIKFALAAYLAQKQIAEDSNE